ncbi:MAG: hypothetical protein QOF51_4071 [Chloroflexota bacterium]|nr:hypothetical protein [Chloroflexota bacterium]
MATLTQIRQQFARVEMMQQFAAGTATSGSTTGLLEDISLKSTIAKNDLYEGWHLLRPAAAAAGDRLRQIPTYNSVGPVGFDVANGKMYPDRVWTNSPWNGASGEAYELHGQPCGF